jgi:hypothetical protein
MLDTNNENLGKLKYGNWARREKKLK